ncbi:hypothetical protein [Legionella steigerwaltii]|uniref:Uncharacterized protein n=1 Tax=Legionella steigerwaltii TaxID=460 RepID=A0ABR5RY43_9GAMM|nr:hypothetical protein [Legionella steigerwaltii]KTD77454.1 hypothetical protein Lstg_1811 [Legionella steigerwaltii]
MSTSKISVDVNAETNPEDKLFQEKLLKLQERIQKIQEKKEIIEQAESLPDVKRAAAFVKNYIEGNKEHNDQQPLDKIMIVFSNKDAREKFIKKHNLYKEEAGDTASDDLPYVKVPPDQIKLIYQNLISEKEERIRQAKCIKNFPGVDSARPHVHNHNWKNEELNRKQPLEKIVICFSSTKHRDEFIKRTSLPKHYMEQHSRLLEVTPDDVKVIYEKWHEIRKQQLADQQKFKENLLEEKQKQTSSQNSHSSDKYIISASEEMKGTIHLSSEKLTSQQKFKEVLAAQKKNQGLISDPTKLLDEFMKEFKKSLEKSKILGITPPSQLMEKYNRAEKYNLTFTIDDVLAHIKSREGKSCRSKEVLGNIIGKEKLESLIKKPEGKLENSMKDESKRSICF